MSSPFTLMRRYEKTMMVVITGVAMVSFVLLGSVQNPQDIPGPLLVLFIAALLGCVAWLAGLSRGKGAEWGISGALVGAILGLVGLIATREASAVLTNSGNLTTNDLSALQRQRSIANRFVQLAFHETFGIPMPPQLANQFLFGNNLSDDMSERDLVLGELLRREGDQMGMTISNEIVMEFIKRLTSKQGVMDAVQRSAGQMSQQDIMMLSFALGQMKDKTFSAEAFTKIRQQLRVSESELLNALRNELKSVQALELLVGRNELTPEAFWDFYRQLNVRQTADIVSIPVSDFIDADAKPSEKELLDLFNLYRQTPPGFTAQGQPESGRPGFMQPRRFQIGYLEATYDKIEPLVGEVTDEEIQKRYEERYKRNVPEGAAGDLNLDLPVLPGMNAPKVDAPNSEAPKADAPAGEPAKPEAPKADGEKKDAEKKDAPAEEKKPEMKADAPASEAPKTEAPKTEAPKADGEKKEAPAEEKKADAPKEDAPKADDKQPTSSLMSFPETQFVAFLQDEPAGDAKKETEAKADEKKEEPKPEAKPESKPEAKPEPKADAPAKPAEKPADGKPADAAPEAPKSDAPKTPAMPAPAGEEIPPPPSPTADVPPLDDALKATLREEILRERTKAEIRKRTTAAYEFLGEVAYKVQRDATESDHLTLEQATKELEKYAEAHHLVYVVTPLLSYQQLANSEDYPIGSAATTAGQGANVAQTLYFSNPKVLYRVWQAENFTTSSGYAFWKLADKADYVPQTIDDEKEIREQVVEAWRRLQAEPKALSRAEALAKQVRESDKPVAEALSEATVTGKEGSLFVTVRNTGEFTWMSQPMVPPTSFRQTAPVTPSVIAGVEKPGPEFYKAIFDDAKVGDVKVLPNSDKSAYYIVKILSRNPSTPEELATFRENFLKEGMQPAYGSLAQRALSSASVNWMQEFFERHEVVMPEQR